jgi:hypothetical protein
MPIFECDNCLDYTEEFPCTLICGSGCGIPDTCPWRGGDTKSVWREMMAKAGV